MRVAMYYSNKDVRLENKPVPSIGPNELLVRVMASGICGSDVMEWYRIKKAPLVLGHEIAGDIAVIGKDVKKFKKGQRVFVSHHVPCNKCKYCRFGHQTACQTLHTTNFDPGGFAEYIRVPEINLECGVFPLPDSLSYEDGTFIEPLACVIRAQRNAGPVKDRSVLILGSGISGILHLLLARYSLAQKVFMTDINRYRLDFAGKLGADACIEAGEDVPEFVKKNNGGMLADLVIVCAGSITAFKQALKSVDKGGTVLFFAPTEPGVELSIPVNEFWRNDLKLLPSYGAGPGDIREAIKVLNTGQIPVRDMITHRLPLSEAGLGFKLVAEGRESLKVIIEPQK